MSTMLPISSSENFWALSQALKPSLGGGDQAMSFDQQLRKMRSPSPASRKATALEVRAASPTNLTERLFNLTGDLKILVSTVSMHLPDEWRKLLFRKLDQLNDPDNWDQSDTLVEPASFLTFLRLVLQVGLIHRTSLGVSSDGHLLAGWRRDKDSLTLEFAANDEIRWTMVQRINGKVESAAGRTNVSRLSTVLAPYAPEVWFGNADAVST